MYRRKIHLRTLLTALSIGSVIVTSGLLLGALFLFQKSNIEESLLDSNIAYARKLADTTDHYLAIAQRELAWSAGQIADLNNVQLLHRETTRLLQQSGFFNSVVVLDNHSIIASISPESLSLLGVKVDTAETEQANKLQKPFISSPFISPSGNYVVFISHPLFAHDGHYLGFIGGTIYLKKQSMLSDILSQHYYGDGTSVSIVSDDGTIIFSQDPTRVGTRMALSQPLQKRLAATMSGQFMIQDAGKKYLIGYASLQKTDWNIFMSGTSETVNGLMMHTARNAFWFILIIIVLTATCMAFLASRISYPLEKLAGMVRDGGSEASPDPLSSVNTWYNEADRLREAVQHHRRAVAGHVADLNDKAMTDPLTGLNNRRGFYAQAAQHRQEPVQSAIAIDIDHFKIINDRYGHDAGDKVLVSLAGLLRKRCRTLDVISRFGGEEFVLLLPGTSMGDAAAMAERIREAVSHTVFPFINSMTVSLGVATLNGLGDDASLLRRADEALYAAKDEGRNCVMVNHEGNISRYPAR
ncbi:sensor domain-containing diguanylate cyclase [Pantoea stewartii]|uniref:sensor domain-containing diguanylate cyclase n=1 Tax=Pantoea stewartii TaxID=66269 RepID=UPI0013DE2773|nr:sensor domain-containing diguanylate cyclase [Pantoea stewartii]QIE99434.1 sensor domain-containing diguanylate cyclase [Pantoea stewartii]UYK99520.1 sensor domain-containing diguanylate cyclase [Pantoea stewartii]